MSGGVPPAYAGRVRTCDFCGRVEEQPGDPGASEDAGDALASLTWSTAVERGRQKTFCDRCSREHLRAMEGKLDSEWW